MKDVNTDGMPPDQRASDTQHVQLHVTIESVSHLPKTDMGPGKCDPYVTLSFFDQKFKTGIRKVTYDAKFNETFRVFVHSESIKAASRMACEEREKAMAAGLFLEFDCWDFDFFDADDLVGKVNILLKDVLDAKENEKLSFVRNLTLDGFPIIGEDGQQSIINISVHKTLLKRKHPKFVQPTLESIRQQSDGTGCHIGEITQKITESSERPAHAQGRVQTVPTVPEAPSSSDERSDIENRTMETMDVEIGYEGVGTKFLNADDRQKMGVDGYDGVENKWSYRFRQIFPCFLQQDQRAAFQSQDFSEDGSVKRPPKNLDGLDTDWREELEKFLESLSVTIFVLLLVVVDVVSLLVSLFESNGEPDYTQRVLSLSIVCCFTFEIKLRLLAQETRFFHSFWNVFDIIVIYASLILSILSFVDSVQMDESGLKEGSSSLRILSRIAIALRVIRIFIQVRKVKKLQNTLTTRLRTAVSQNKRRFTQNGFDLDLTYITDRIIAMSAPAIGGASAYRNSIQTVQRFLSLRHYASFYVFNLCDTSVSSDGLIGNYHAQMFMNHVQRIPFEDHGPPLLLELIHFCREATKWMQVDPKFVIAVHCKGGKGRTGIMIAAFLLWCGHRKCAMDAMELFTFRRTENYDPAAGIDESIADEEDEPTSGPKMKSIFKPKKQPNRGVDGPSQQRYVFYVEAMLYCGVDIFSNRSTLLKSIRLSQNPTGKALHLSYTVRCQRTLVFDTCSATSQTVMYGGPGKTTQELVLPAGVLLDGKHFSKTSPLLLFGNKRAVN